MKNMRALFWIFLLFAVGSLAYSLGDNFYWDLLSNVCFAVAAVVVFSQEKDWHSVLFITMLFLTVFLCDAFCWIPVSGELPLLYGVVWFAKADI